MRIAVTGAQGSGKSTLARSLRDALADAYGNCALLDGIGARIRAEGFPLGRLATWETICAFASNHLERERGVLSRFAVQDRCMLDLVAYSVAVAMPSVLIRFVEESAFASLRDVPVLYVPLNRDLPPSESHDEDDAFRRLVDREIVSGAKRLDLRLISVDGPLESRATNALAAVRAVLADTTEAGAP